MGGSAIFGAISLILTAGACVMTFFVILAGTSTHTPLDQVYFLWADTSKIPNAPSRTQWTLWNFCDGSSGKNVNCGNVRPAYPFLPQSNFGTDNGVPADFLNHHNTFYYLSRFMFAFYLISIFFMVCSLATGLLSLCSRLGSAISSFTASIALFSLTLTAALMTSVFVIGRDKFRGAGDSAQVGIKAFAFTWASVACMFLAMVLYCLGFTASRRERRTSRIVATEKRSGGRSFFHRKRSPGGDSEQRFT